MTIPNTYSIDTRCFDPLNIFGIPIPTKLPFIYREDHIKTRITISWIITKLTKTLNTFFGIY